MKEEQIVFSDDERWLLNQLSHLIGNSEESQTEQNPDWNRIYGMARIHGVVPFLYSWVNGENMPANIATCIQETSVQIVQQSYRLLFLTHFVVEQLRRKGILVVVLKGVSIAGEYKVPELRKSGDVDLFLPRIHDLHIARQVMEQCGFAYKEEQHANHHYVWRTDEGIDIEIHTMLVEPFDNGAINGYLELLSKRIQHEIIEYEVMGLTFPVLTGGIQAYQLLLHMLQHFLRSGFGLKLLCDWVVFWNRMRPEADVMSYREMVQESGLSGFSDMITSLCSTYLGLRANKARQILFQHREGESYDAFLRDILDGAEFGQNDPARMVVMRGTRSRDYMREFHHQMILNHPWVEKKKLLWPIYWIKTFAEFCRNNKQKRNISTRQILQMAGRRSKNVEKLKLFQLDTTRV